MSQQNQYTICCPQCSGEQDVLLYDTIHVGQTPELKNALLDNTLNRVRCCHCDFQFTVDKRLLYHDPEQGLMLLLLPSSPGQLEKNETEFQKTILTLNKILPKDMIPPIVYLVINRTELVERVFLHEEGIDAREAEYMKHIIYTNYHNRIDPQKKNLLFNAKDSTKENLLFVVQDIATQKFEGSVEFKRATYQIIHDTFAQDEQAALILELFPGPYINARTTLLAE